MKNLYAVLFGAWVAWLPMSQARAATLGGEAGLATVSGTAAESSDRQKLVAWFGEQDFRAGTKIDLDGGLHGVLYMRGVSIGQKGLGLGSSDAKPYLDFNLGGDFENKEKPQMLVLLMIHPVNTTEAIIRRLPFKDRVSVAKLPDVEIGPALSLPRPGQAWTWRSSFGIVAAIGF